MALKIKDFIKNDGESTIRLAIMREQRDSTFCKSKTKQKLFMFSHLDSLKVSESLLIHKSPKWILRYAQYDEVGRICV